MDTWQKVLMVVAVLGAVAAEGCHSNEPDQQERFINRKVDRCFRSHFHGVKDDPSSERHSLEGFRNFTQHVCSHVEELTSCLAGVRNHVASNCETTNLTSSFVLISELVEHLFTAGCENDGDRLPHIAGFYFLLDHRRDIEIPLRRCFVKRQIVIELVTKIFYDRTSYSYLLYRELGKFKTCVPYIEDESYKSAVQWLLDEVAASMKCQHPDEKSTVLCSAIDASTVSPTNICELAEVKLDDLYDKLEDDLFKMCYGKVFNYDQEEDYSSQIKDLEFLKSKYREICKNYRELPTCILKLSGLGESCLSQEEDKHFQLEVQGVEDYMSRLCVEDGVFLATVMHEVYKNIPERGHAFRDCYQTVKTHAQNHTSHEASNRSMRFYHDTVEYNKCVVDKFHGTSELSSNLQTALNDILKKMKCVNPEDGSVVLCETIHQH